MTQQKQHAVKKEKHVSSDLQKLEQKAESVKKNMEKAFSEYEAKAEEYLKGKEDKLDKPALFRLSIAAKLAKLKYKMKRVEHKMAKFEMKTGRKKEKKETVAVAV